MAVQDFTTEELENEIWKEIPGFEGLYSVSNLGRVRRDKSRTSTKAGRILNPIRTDHGYTHSKLYSPTIKRIYFTHRLVMLAFIGPCQDGMQINHKDGKKNNNRLGNLEYVTPKENAAHAKLHGLYLSGDENPARRNPERMSRGEKNGGSKLLTAEVLLIYYLLKKGHRICDIIRRTGIPKHHIKRIKKGEAWHHLYHIFQNYEVTKLEI